MAEAGGGNARLAQIQREQRSIAFRFDQSYQALTERAEGGDPIAAYQLWQGLRVCDDVPRDANSLQHEEHRLLETRLIKGEYAGDEGVKQHIQYLDKVFPFCSGTPQDSRSLGWKWLLAAAKSGLVYAQLDVLMKAFRTLEPAPPELKADRQQILAMVEEAALGGHPLALSNLAITYTQDREDLPHDDVKALAYMRASRESTGLPSPGPDALASGNPADPFVQILARLSATDLAEAETLKNRIVRAGLTNDRYAEHDPR